MNNSPESTECLAGKGMDQDPKSADVYKRIGTVFHMHERSVSGSVFVISPSEDFAPCGRGLVSPL